jgi:rubrerythrin
MVGKQLFDGRPVIGFHLDRDRRNFIKWAGIIGCGGTLAVLTRDRFASAQGDNGDIDILNYALSLEYLEADFYDQGIQADLLSGREQELVNSIHQHETEHVAALESTVQDLGGTPVETPTFSYPNETFGNRNSFLRAAFDLETLTVKAYHGQVTKFSNSDLLAAAASIAGTESRHAAILADLTGNDPFPAPLEVGESRNKVLNAARPYIEG